MKAIMGNKGSISEDVVVKYNNMINKDIPEYHSIEEHNEQIKQLGKDKCILCQLGSKPVHKSVLEEMKSLPS